MNVPYSEHAEQSVVAQLLAKPSIIGQVVGTQLLPEHFYMGSFKLLYDEVTAAYYADEPLDALTIAEHTARKLAGGWKCTEKEAVERVKEMAAGGGKASTAVEHAKLVKREHDYRQLIALARRIQEDVATEERSPDEIAGAIGELSMQIATSTLHVQEFVTFEELGRSFYVNQRKLQEAKRQGIEIAAKFGLPFIDDYTKGLKPGELFILSGEPGSGKSAVAWSAAQRFGERQLTKPRAEDRMAALVLSLEMSEDQSGDRYGQSVGGVSGGKIREGATSDDELRNIMAEWGARKDLPLIFNFASHMRASQMRAMIVEAIRRYHVGFIVIDHMRYFDMDHYIREASEADEAKAAFLARIAKDLNVAIMLLAHTTKEVEKREDRRPRLSDLRGGGMVAAHADFVAFVFRPYPHAKQEDIDSGNVRRTDAELIYGKNRWGLDGTARFYLDGSTMTVGGRATKGGPAIESPKDDIPL